MISDCIIISSVEELYEIKEEYVSSRIVAGNNREQNFCYRGQSDADWRIVSSLERYLDENQADEANLIWIFKEIEGGSLFDKIAYAQHYYSKTRFIDFTRNIDVALYFAINENVDKDGAVYLYNYFSYMDTSTDALVFTEIINAAKEKVFCIREISEQLLKNERILEAFPNASDLDAYIISKLDHGFMIIQNNPNPINQRIINQQGCFYVAGYEPINILKSEDRWASRAGMVKYYNNSFRDFEEINDRNTLLKCIIPKDIKEECRYELNRKGITDSFIYPQQ